MLALGLDVGIDQLPELFGFAFYETAAPAVRSRERDGGRAALSAVRIRCGVRGVSLTSTPNPRSASFTALKIAAGGGMAPPSPTPLMPYSVLGDGVSIWCTTMRGMSVAAGRI